MLIRNVGHLMTNPAIIYSENKEVPEGIMDTVITTMISMFDLKNGKNNSKTGSVYIVKPKMHGLKKWLLQLNYLLQLKICLDYQIIL